MRYKHELPAHLQAQAVALAEFANGAAQCHAKLHDGSIHGGLLVSNATAIIAMRGHSSLPFPLAAIALLLQQEDDKNPRNRGGWEYFDNWSPEPPSSKDAA